MQHFYILLDILDTNTADTADRSLKVTVYHILIDTDGFKDLGSLIRLDGRNSHLGCDLDDAADNGFIIRIHCRIIIFVKHVEIDQFLDALLCQIWIDGRCTIAQKGCKMVYLSRFSTLQDHRKACPLFGLYQILL